MRNEIPTWVIALIIIIIGAVIGAAVPASLKYIVGLSLELL